MKIASSSFLILIVAVLIYSTSGVFSKLAAQEDFLSLKYIIFLGLVIMVLGIYAILWQIALKITPLSKAYLYKSLSIIMGLLFAYFFFNEKITINNILGATAIISGLFILNAKAI